MLQSLISLTDHDVARVTDAVRQWCSAQRIDVDSSEGHRALTVAIDLVLTRRGEALLEELVQRLDRE